VEVVSEPFLRRNAMQRSPSRQNLRAFVLVTWLLSTASLWADDSGWTYRADPADGLLPPIYRAVPVSLEQPDEVGEEVTYRGQSQRYAQLRYGTDDSTRVLLVVDEVKRNDVDVYVDTNRNRIIEPQDRIDGVGPVYRIPLDVEMTEGIEPVYRARIILLRRGVLPDMVSVATCGCATGTVEIDGGQVVARRVDGNANGLFADSSDRVWLDLNNDGQWSGITEQFPFLPILRVAQRRFAMRADRLGEYCRLEEIIGTGQLKIQLASIRPEAEVSKLEVMFMGDDGSAFSVRGLEDSMTVPVGKYAVGAVNVTVRDETSPEPWTFVFSRAGGAEPEIWYDVQQDAATDIDPLCGFRFELALSDGNEVRRAGQQVTVRPRLFTGDGLLINASHLGEADRYSSQHKHNAARIQLRTLQQRKLGSATSGFS
jgi:hypothetical protein